MLPAASVGNFSSPYACHLAKAIAPLPFTDYDAAEHDG